MKLILDDEINIELKEYLLLQEGITNVKLDNNKFLTILNIEFNEKTSPEIIIRHIELFQDNKYSTLFEFDKETKCRYEKIKYIIEDMCCEYCYMGLVRDLFSNKFIKSVKSNFDYTKPAFNIEFDIEFSKQYSKNDLIEFIKEKNN